MSRISALPTVGMSHMGSFEAPLTVGETFPTSERSGIGQPGAFAYRWVAQLFSRIGTPSRGPSILHRSPIRGNLPRRLRPYRVEASETFFELAHCPKCGTDAGVFRRRWPYGLVCRACWEGL